MMKQVYCDPAEFYNVAGWLATSMNTTIFHCDRLLKNIDWDDFRKRYFLRERISMIILRYCFIQ